MKANKTLKMLSLTFFFGLGVALTANAMDTAKYKFTKDMHMNILTVTNNHFTSYDALLNKPLAQLILINSYQKLSPVSHENNNNMFEVAMHVQDKIQYYLAVMEDVFAEPQASELANAECSNSKLTKIANLFSF